ncbi:MAG: cytochrome c3 family protein [Bacteroidales bacterium]
MKRFCILFYPVLLTISFLFPVQTLTSQNIAPPEWQQCTACHVMGKKLIGPDLTGVTEKRSEAWLISFIRNSQAMIEAGDPEAVQVWEEHNRIPMQSFDFTDEQIKEILTFIRNFDPAQPVVIATSAEEETAAAEQLAASEKLDEFLFESRRYGPGNTQPTFIIFLVLILLSIIDLGYTKLIRVKFVHIIVILVSVFVVGEIVYVEAKSVGRQEGYSPDQPVWFSHKVHAGQNKIDCLYCHHTAETGKSAGIPSTQLCMNCHNVVKRGTITGEVEIAKVLESWETGNPIEWVRVHNLPDHVWFSHAQHVNAGNRDCQECHGPVKKMDRITQVHDLSMGWCLDCHRQAEVLFESNSFYQQYHSFHEEIKSGRRSRVTVDDIGGANCHTCHH